MLCRICLCDIHIALFVNFLVSYFVNPLFFGKTISAQSMKNISLTPSYNQAIGAAVHAKVTASINSGNALVLQWSVDKVSYTS